MNVKVNILIKGLGWLEIVPKEKPINGLSAVEMGGRLLELDNIEQVQFTKVIEN